jgi:DNA-directed RNA polymerase subunit RPC12/RpoP
VQVVVVFVIIGIIFVLAFIKAMQPAERAKAAEKARLNKSKISQVGKQTGGGLACPKCGSTQFKAKRSAGGKVMGGVLAPKTRVRCVACGQQFMRG